MKFNHIILILTATISPLICLGSGNPLTLKKIPQISNINPKVQKNALPYLCSSEEVNNFIEQQTKNLQFKEDAKKITDAWDGYNSDQRMKLDPAIYQSIQRQFSTSNALSENALESQIATLSDNVGSTIEILYTKLAEVQKQIEIDEQENKQLKEQFALLIVAESNTTDNAPTEQKQVSKSKKRRDRKKKNQTHNTLETPIALTSQPVAATSPTTVQDKHNDIPEQIPLRQKRSLNRLLLQQYNQKNPQQLGECFLNISNKLELQGKSNCFQEQIGNTNYYFSFCKECQEVTIFHKNNKIKPLAFYYCITAYLCDTCTLNICAQNIVNIVNRSEKKTRFCKVNGLTVDIHAIEDEISKLHHHENK